MFYRVFVPGPVTTRMEAMHWLDGAEGRRSLAALGYDRCGERGREALGICAGLIDEGQSPSYRVLLFGAAGVGKTSCAARLTGRYVPKMYVKTPGLQVFDVQWPTRLDGLNVIITNLEMWDVGTVALKDFVFLRSDMLQRAAVILYVCSALDKKSVSVVDHLLGLHRNEAGSGSGSRSTLPLKNHAIIVTKMDEWAHHEVSDAMLATVSARHGNVPIFRLSNRSGDEAQEIFHQSKDVRSLLDFVASCVQEHTDTLAASV